MSRRSAGRLLLSAGVAATVLAGALLALVLILNPQATLAADGRALGTRLFAPYFAAATIGFLALGTLASALPLRAHRPPLPGYPWFSTLTLLATGGAAAVYWLNLTSYGTSIPVPAVEALLGSSLALTACALALSGAILDAVLFPERPRPLAAPVVVLAAGLGLAVPLALRPAPVASAAPAIRLALEPMTPARRIILLGIDGLDLAEIQRGVDAGRLPGFARLLRKGASGRLGTLRPTEGPPIWTTLLTGRFPRDHGIKSFATYRLAGSPRAFEILPKAAFVGRLETLGLVERRPVVASDRRRRPLWEQLDALGIASGVVRVWGTHPARPVRGFLLSPYYHLLLGDPGQAATALQPPDLQEVVRARVVDPTHVDPALLAEFVDPGVEAPSPGVEWRRQLVEDALAADLTYQRAGAALREAYDPPFFVSYAYGLDVVGHTFLRFARPEAFGNVDPVAARKWGRVLDRYLAFLSDWVDGFARELRPGEILIVVSGYGMEPTPLPRRAFDAATGQGRGASGTHASAPDGTFLALGDGIRPGAHLAPASVLDVAPTVLYMMGLPVGRDMEGRVLTEVVDEEFRIAHPLSLIPSYEGVAAAPPPPPGDEGVDLPPLPEERP